MFVNGVLTTELVNIVLTARVSPWALVYWLDRPLELVMIDVSLHWKEVSTHVVVLPV